MLISFLKIRSEKWPSSKIVVFLNFAFTAMSVLPVVIDMEYVISFINSEISRGEEEAAGRGPGHDHGLAAYKLRQPVTLTNLITHT